MPDIIVTNQLPPRTTTNHRWPRKGATLCGRASSSTTTIPTNDSDLIDDPSKTNGHQRHSTSLFRKSSTKSRTDDTENAPSLTKSRSLMNVIRSKFNSPAVLRRFRSKSRESTKQTVIEIDDQQEITRKKSLSLPKSSQSNDENKNEQITTTRKSRKREPSPMRRFANRIAQLTHKSPSKVKHDETKISSSPTHNKDEVDHINSCYDEIRAKYFDSNNKRNTSSTIQPSCTSNDYNDRSLLSNDFLNNSQRFTLPDDPLLQARKQSNIKLNCMLSGYGFTSSYNNHERLLGENNLFKFHHYHDVGKRKYDWNFTNENNRTFASTRTRPISKSIDSFRRTNANENEVPVVLEKIHIVDDELMDNQLAETENSLLNTNEDSPITTPYDNELFIREDSDLLESEQKTSYSSDVHSKPAAAINFESFTPSSSPIPDENKKISDEQTSNEQDEEFERSFLRAVDRALGVVNKDQDNLTQPLDDVPIKTEESNLNLSEMTERALSSFHNSPLFANDDQNKEQFDNEHITNDAESPNNRTDEHIDNEQSPLVNNDKTVNENRLEEKKETINDETVNENPLAEEKEETTVNENRLAEEKKTINDKTVNENQLAEEKEGTLVNDNRLAEETKTINDETVNENQLAEEKEETTVNENRLAEEKKTINDETVNENQLAEEKEGTLVNDNRLAEETKTINDETVNENQLAEEKEETTVNENRLAEEKKTINDETVNENQLAEEKEETTVNENRLAEEKKTINDETVNENQLAEEKEDTTVNENRLAEEKKTINDETVNENQLAEEKEGTLVNDNRLAEETKTINDETVNENQLAEEKEETTVNENRLAEEKKTINDETVNENQLAEEKEETTVNENRLAEEKKTINDETVNENQLAEEKEDTTVNENRLAEEKKTINDETVNENQLAEEKEDTTVNDNRLAEETKTINDETVNENQLAEEKEETTVNENRLAEEKKTINDETVNENQLAEEKEDTTVNENRLAEEKKTINDETVNENQLAEEKEGTLVNDNRLAEETKTINDETVNENQLAEEKEETTVNENRLEEAKEDTTVDENRLAEETKTINDETVDENRLAEETKTINDETVDENRLAEETKTINDKTVNENQIEEEKEDKAVNKNPLAEEKETISNKTVNENRLEEETVNDKTVDEDVWSIIDELIRKTEELVFEESKNGQAFLANLDDEEKIIKSKADTFNKLLETDDDRLTEDVRTDINAVIGEVNLLLRGKLKQFRGLCQANVAKSTTVNGEPIPLDSDLEGFWDITYPLIDKVKEKFAKLDARKAKQWAPIEEYDPHDVNNRPRVIDDRLKQLQPQQNKLSKTPVTKSANDDLKKLIQERRKAAANTTNQNHDVEIFVAPK